MKNFKLTIQYDGTRYCGWQTQPIRGGARKRSIQQTINRCLREIVHEKVNVFASGRTDSGVHASGQVVHCKTNAAFSAQKLRRALNGVLPRDIRVSGAEEVGLTFHAQYSATGKAYRYYIQQEEQPAPFLNKYSYWSKFSLNVRLMKEGAYFLVGRHDFASFCASGSAVGDTVRTIKRISITTTRIFSCRVVCIEIEGDGFLYNMVRNIVGTLLDVGRGRISPQSMRGILKRKDRAAAGQCVPAKGLFLLRVNYK